MKDGFIWHPTRLGVWRSNSVLENRLFDCLHLANIRSGGGSILLEVTIESRRSTLKLGKIEKHGKSTTFLSHLRSVVTICLPFLPLITRKNASFTDGVSVVYITCWKMACRKMSPMHARKTESGCNILMIKILLGVNLEAKHREHIWNRIPRV